MLSQTGGDEKFYVRKISLENLRALFTAFVLLLRGPRHGISWEITQTTDVKTYQLSPSQVFAAPVLHGFSALLWSPVAFRRVLDPQQTLLLLLVDLPSLF